MHARPALQARGFTLIESLVALGVTRVAVASAVIRAADPPRAARELIDTLARLTAAKPA